MVKKLVPATVLATLAFAAPAAAQSVALASARRPGRGRRRSSSPPPASASRTTTSTARSSPSARSAAGRPSRPTPTAATSCTAWTPRAPTPSPTPPRSTTRALPVCAWLQEYSGDSVAVAATSVVVNVRSAQRDARHHRPDPPADRHHRELQLHRDDRGRPPGLRHRQARRRPPVRLLVAASTTATTSSGRTCRATTACSTRRTVRHRRSRHLPHLRLDPGGLGRPRARGGRDLHLHRRHPGALRDRPQPRHERPPRGPLGQALRHPQRSCAPPAASSPAPSALRAAPADQSNFA